MTETQVLAEITEIVRGLFLRECIELQMDTTARDIEGWDSFRHIEIMLAVETHFNVRLTSRDIDEVDCVGDLVNIISRRV